MYVNQSTSELIIKNIEEGDEAVYTCLSIESTYNQFKSKQISVVVEGRSLLIFISRIALHDLVYLFGD